MYIEFWTCLWQFSIFIICLICPTELSSIHSFENIMELHIGYLVEWSFFGCKEAYIVNCTFLIASIRIFVLYVKYTFIWFKLLYVQTRVVDCIVMCKRHIPTLSFSLMPESAASSPPHQILEVVHKISVALVARHTEADFAALKWTVYYDSIYMILKIQVIFLLCVTDYYYYYYYYYYFTFHLMYYVHLNYSQPFQSCLVALIVRKYIHAESV